MILKKLSLDEWNTMSREAHFACFHESRETVVNTCDYALLVTDDKDRLICYATVIEMDKFTSYMQHGGAFPEFSGTTFVARGYHLMIAFLKENYNRISTRIKNINTPMIKLALSADLIINGIDYSTGELFLNFSWEKGV